MKKETLKDWFKFQVWRQSGGTLPELCDLSEIREWLNETADDPDLDARISIVEAFEEAASPTLSDPGVYRKLQAAKNSTDQLHEILYNKSLKEPVINDPDLERATIEIPCGASRIDLTAVVQGVAGNAYTVEIIEDGENTELSCTCSEAGALVVNLATDGSGTATTTVEELVEELRETENYNDLFLDSTTGDLDELVEAMTETNFSGGADGHKLQATSEEIDNAVAAVQTAIEGAPDAPEAAKLVTGSGENWEITWDAVTKGDAGNAVSIEIVNGTKEESPITISTTGNSISIALATDALGAPDNAANTATNVLTELNADKAAGALVQGTRTGRGGVCATELSANLAGGVDGTPGAKGALRFGATALYVSTDESTTAVSNWKSITFDTEEG